MTSEEPVTVGIDRMAWYTPNRFLDLDDLARARGVDPDKYRIGIGQRRMAVPTLDQDVVVMGANAAERMLGDVDSSAIGLLVVATESGVDQSKASALFVQGMLGLEGDMRAIEIKEACYGGTAGIQLASDFVRSHPRRTALVIASDIARYGLGAGGEVTQGAGAVAMLIAANPAILALEPTSVYRSCDADDFWRPNYATEAFAKGKYSEQLYLRIFAALWRDAERRGLAQTEALQALLFHIPFTKMGRKGLRSLAERLPDDAYARLERRFEESIRYGRDVGNCYTASLYLGLMSLLEHDTTLGAGDRIGLFSYGSGAVGELFFGVLQDGFQRHLHAEHSNIMLAQRRRLTMDEYETMFRQRLVTDGSTQVLDVGDRDLTHRLVRVEGHERHYV